MNWAPAEKIATAVLYEGYLLYPYRTSAAKNLRRWSFGEVAPDGAAGFGTVCLLEGSSRTRLSVRLRFLQDLGSSVVERDVPVVGAGRHPFAFPPIEGEIDIRLKGVGEGLYRVTLTIVNRGQAGGPAASLHSCHALLGVEAGAFVSMTDPPERFRDAAAACEPRGLWPILAGPEGDRSLLLAAPIILPDHPGVAPESPRDFFDGTEIDEMLALRVMTLTDGEKAELKAGDARGRQVLERTEQLTEEELLSLHGRMTIPGKDVRVGDRVRLRPRGRADIMDLSLEGRTATVVSLEEDLEGKRYIAVAVDDDPGRDLAARGFPGHRFFFSPAEVEPL